jgi:Uma2 family endonuclease
MVATRSGRFITPEEYIELERDAETKSEYDDGVIVAMAGGSPEYAAITFSLGAELGPHLRAAGCRGFSSDLRVRVDVSNRYYYPDLAVVCGQPEYETINGVRSLRNPSIIVEVLSDSTEMRDRGTKWLAYKTIDSISMYLLVHQNRPYIEVYMRAGDKWEYRAVEGLDAVLALPALGGEVALAGIYADVDFAAAAEREA